MASDIVAGESPIALGIEVADFQRCLQAELDARHGVADLAGDKLQTAARRLVVEKNARARKQSVALAVIDREPVAVQLGYSVRTARIKLRLLVLNRLADHAEHFAG